MPKPATSHSSSLRLPRRVGRDRAIATGIARRLRRKTTPAKPTRSNSEIAIAAPDWIETIANRTSPTAEAARLSLTAKTFGLAADLVLSDRSATVNVPGVGGQPHSPAEDRKDRPEEVVGAGERPDHHQH